MHPVICQIGPFAIYSYGVMLAIAVLVCASLLQREAEQKGLPAEFAFDLVFLVTVWGVIGARIFYIFLNFSFFLNNPVEIVMIQHGGLAWQGGLILGGVAAALFFKKRKTPFLKTADLIAPYVALGQSIGRIGCFLNGCCYGRKVSWGIYFPVHHAHLHPTQLYSSAGLLLIFLILKARKKASHFEGEIFLLYIFLASLLRFLVEFFRADHQIIFFHLSIFQIVTVCLMAGSLYVYLFLERRSR